MLESRIVTERIVFITTEDWMAFQKRCGCSMDKMVELHALLGIGLIYVCLGCHCTWVFGDGTHETVSTRRRIEVSGNQTDFKLAK